MTNTKINELIQAFATYTDMYDELQKELRTAKAENDHDKINKYTARLETVEYLLESKSVAIQKAVSSMTNAEKWELQASIDSSNKF